MYVTGPVPGLKEEDMHQGMDGACWRDYASIRATSQLGRQLAGTCFTSSHNIQHRSILGTSWKCWKLTPVF